MAKLLKYKQTRHGYHGTPVYKIWGGMVKRCENKTSDNYKNYGGRGIKVCEEWRMNPGLFCDWAIANGFEKGKEIDRINRDGDYEPDNCRFITHSENTAPNKRVFSNNKTGYNGISKTSHGRYEVWVTLNRKQKYLGVRKELLDAVKLRDEFIDIHDNQSLLINK